MIRKLLYIFIGASICSLSYAGSIKLKQPPKELDKYYPPNSEHPVFLYNMYGMSTAFTGMLTNIKEKDWTNAKKWANELKERYLKIGQMVPKWNKVLRKKEINLLVKAVENKDVNSINKYTQIVGKSCSQCHKAYSLSVKIKYHYPEYDLVSIEDPVSMMEYNIHDYMKKMTTDYKLIKVYISDNKQDKAKKITKNFVKRFKNLTQSCSECHTNNEAVENVYFGKNTEKLLKQLLKSVSKGDKKLAMKSLGQIGGVCYKCHNVHEIPAMIKEKFE